MTLADHATGEVHRSMAEMLTDVESDAPTGFTALAMIDGKAVIWYVDPPDPDGNRRIYRADCRDGTMTEWPRPFLRHAVGGTLRFLDAPEGAVWRRWMPSEQPSVATSVYFIQSGDGPIKIGIAGNVNSRLISLQTGNPEPLRLLATIPGDRGTEARLHRRFASDRLSGEWFRASDVLLAYVAEVSQP